MPVEAILIVVAALFVALLIGKGISNLRARPRRRATAAAIADPPATIEAAPPAQPSSVRFTSRAGAQWVEPGTAIEVAGFRIADGMVYVGSRLPAVAGQGGRALDESDPALIDPGLPVARASADLTGSTMTYWPSYAGIDPAARAAYLRWLATGKSESQAYIGYVFLYFYGLERRLLIDRPSAEETARLVAEVERLRSIYGGSGSFDRYSLALLDAADLLGLAGSPVDPDSVAPDLLARDTKLGLPVKIRIGRLIKEGQPLPFELTLAAYMSANRLPMPADRCRPEFVALMQGRLAAKYPSGFKVRPRHGPIQTWYRGASRHIAFDLLQDCGLGEIPDPDLMNWERLDELVAGACEALGPYARFIGRRPDRAGTLEAKNLLPPEIKAEAVTDAGGDLRAWLDREVGMLGTVPLRELAGRVIGPVDDKLGAKTVRALADILDEFGYGVEPDPRFTSFRADGDDVALVFKAPNPAELAAEPRPAYRLAAAIVTLVAGIAIASSDGFGAHELAWVDWIDKRLALTPTEGARLRAHLHWLVAKKITLGQIKKMLAAVPAGERESVARFAAVVAAADGTIEKGEIAFLEKICDELGVARTVLYSALHEAAPAASPAESPPGDGGFKIPKPPAAAKPGVPGARAELARGLDRDRIAKVMAETQKVSAILAGVFVDDSAAASQTAAPNGHDKAFDGLDEAHGRLLAKLLAQPSWTRAAFDAAARTEGLMPDGALETINEWAFDVADDALIEDDGDLKVNQALGRDLST